MPEYEVDAERINVFRIDEEYLFKHYFERTDLFESLREYYNDETYRFEIPAAEFVGVQERLADDYYDLVVIDDPEPYCVVKEQYTKHAEILRTSVMNWERRGHLFFVMPDELAVERAIEQGARRLGETEFVLGI